MKFFASGLNQIGAFHQKYDRYIFPLVILVAFLFDEWKFHYLGLVGSGIFLFGYFILIGLGIYFFHFFNEKHVRGRVAQRVFLWLPVVIQYGFGGLFSAFLVFYLRSTTFGVSLIFILLLIGILIMSEVARDKFFRLDFQMGMFFAALFLYLFFVVSIALGKVGTGPFLLSSVMSILVIIGFLYFLWPFVSEKFRGLRSSLSVSLLMIFLSLNTLYFLGLIPPIPLALKDVGVYHKVERVGDTYVGLKEEDSGGDLEHFFFGYDREIEHVPGTPVYVFSAVYAPGRVSAKIVHVWQYYNESTGSWETTDRIPFPISGGRKSGYRGYTEKTSLLPGHWRVNIETKNGALIGRASFNVHTTTSTPVLQRVTL